MKKTYTRKKNKPSFWAKAVAGFVSAALTVSVLYFPVGAQTGRNDYGNDTEQITGSAILPDTGNSFGEMLTKTAAEQQTTSQNYISDVELSGKKAVVRYCSNRDCTVVVGIYNDNGTKLLSKVSGEAKASEQEVSLDFDFEADSYLLKAFLLDKQTNRPLGKVYVDDHATAAFAEFYEKTADDFSEDKVLNLDQDMENNFAVFRSKTVQIDGTSGSCELSSVSNGTYVFDNASDAVKNLKTGDCLYYEQGEQSWLIKVKDSKISDKTVTITEEECSLEDFFEYIKIEQTSCQVQEVSQDNGTTARRMRIQGVEDAASWTQDAGIGYEEINELTYDFKSEKKSEDKTASAMLQVSLAVSFKTEVAVYYDGVNDLEVDMGITPMAKGNVHAEGSYAETFSMDPLEVPLGHGLFMTFTPSLIVDASAKLDYDYKLEATAGFSYSTTTGLTNRCVAPFFENALNIEGDLYVGVKLNPGLYFISEKLVNAGMAAEAGLYFHAQMAADNTTVNKDVQHECLLCLKGETYRRFILTANVEVLGGMEIWGHEAKKEWTLFGGADKEVKIDDFYYSMTKGKGGKGLCPYQKYRTCINVVDQDNNPYPGVTVYIGDTKTAAGTTDANGKFETYCANGTYLFIAKNEDGQYASSTVIVKDGVSETTMKLAQKEDEGWRQAYIEFLKDYYEYGKTNSFSSAEDRFFLGYIDEDTIPELMIVEGNYHGAPVFVYSYDREKVNQVGQYGENGTFEYVEKGNLIASYWNGWEATSIYFSKIENGVEKVVHKFEADAPQGIAATGEAEKYTYNGVEMTFSQYESKLNEVQNKNFVSKGYEDGVAITEENVIHVLGTDWQKAYWDYLTAYVKKSGNSKHTFSLEYIDQDDVPELAISSDYTKVTLYNYVQQNVNKVEDFSYLHGFFRYVEKNNLIEFFRSRQGSETYTYCSIQNGEIDYRETLSCDLENLEGETSEKAEFIEELKKIAEGKTWIKREFADFSSITEANIFAKLTQSPESTTTQTSSIQEAGSAMQIQTEESPATVAAASNKITKTLSAKDLTPGKEYLLLVVKDKNAENLLAADNIIYIDQKTAGTDSDLTFVYETDVSGKTELVFEEYEALDVVYGDVDSDGAVTLKDAQFVLKGALKIAVLNDTQKAAADVDGDAETTLKDAQLVLKKALRIIEVFPIQAA